MTDEFLVFYGLPTGMVIYDLKLDAVVATITAESDASMGEVFISGQKVIWRERIEPDYNHRVYVASLTR